METDLSSFFSSPERSKGAELVRKDVVSISSASDTDVRAFVKGSSACRVALMAEQVAGPVFTASCTCPYARKGELCRHVWAVVLKLETDEADFLIGKNEVLAPSQKTSPADQARQAKQEIYKIELRQKAKERNKSIAQKKKNADRGPRFTYPAPVQESLDYFAANGFEWTELELPAIQNARKLLSRVFHPDKGGTHDEVLELNAHYDVLEDYVKS